MGPVQYAQHLISGPRLPFTAAYFGSITLTLVFAIKVSVHFLHVDGAGSSRPGPRPRTPLPSFVATLGTCLLTTASHDSYKTPS